MPQGVTLTVTDSRGMTADDSVLVTVESSVGGTYVPVDKFGVLFSLLSKPQFLAIVTLFAAVIVGLAWRKKRNKGVVGLLLAFAIFAGSFVIAIPIVNAQPKDDLTNNRELGVDVGINPGDALYPYAWSSSNGFYTTLVGTGWAPRFRWTGASCWEEDYKYRNGPDAIPWRGSRQGGTDYYNGWPSFPWYSKDAVDFAYYVGHGCPTFITFPCGSLCDFGQFSFTNARWGGTTGGQSAEEADLEWMTLESCNTLQWWPPGGQNVFNRWSQAFCGLHYVLGFDTVAMATMTLGGTFATRLTWGWTVRNAWISATVIVQPAGIWAAYLRAGTGAANTFNDCIPPWWVSPDPWPWTYLAYMNWAC